MEEADKKQILLVHVRTLKVKQRPTTDRSSLTLCGVLGVKCEELKLANLHTSQSQQAGREGVGLDTSTSQQNMQRPADIPRAAAGRTAAAPAAATTASAMNHHLGLEQGGTFNGPVML